MDEEESDDLVRPGTKDTRELETTFVKYQEFPSCMISEWIITFEVEAQDDSYAGVVKCNNQIDVDRYQEIFRDMISEHMMDENSGDHMVGGPGCIVEVDVAIYGWCYC